MSPIATRNRPPGLPASEADRPRPAPPERPPAEVLAARHAAVRQQVERALARATGPLRRFGLEK
jgi:hypothetical protein